MRRKIFFGYCAWIATMLTAALFAYNATIILVEGAQVRKTEKIHGEATTIAELKEPESYVYDAPESVSAAYDQIVREYENLDGCSGIIYVESATEEDYRRFFEDYYLGYACAWNQAQIAEWGFAKEEYWKTYFYVDNRLIITEQLVGMRNISEANQKNASSELALIECGTEDSNLQKVGHIVSYMAENTTYDIDRAYAETYFENHYTRCSGYAEALYDMCKAAGIPCRIIFGKSTNSAGNTRGHAWNQVYSDGKWYYCDPTWYDCETNGIDVTYLASEELWESHAIEKIVCECN